MEDLQVLKVSTTALTILLLILSALGILWTVFCSWLTGRKQRQRVANNVHVADVVLDVETPLTSAKGKSPDRYSAVEQVIILPIDDLAQSLHVPTIVVTPPTPQDTPLDTNSFPSESSIGSADDLIPEDQNVKGDIDFSYEVGTEFDGVGTDRKVYGGDSMRNVLDSDPSTDSQTHSVPQEACSLEGMTFPDDQCNWTEDVRGVNSCGGRGQGGTSSSMKSSSPGCVMSVANVTSSHIGAVVLQ